MFLYSATSKRSKLFPVLLVMSALAAETALASWFPLRIGRRQSRASLHPASVGIAAAAAATRRRKESQIHRVWGRPTGSIRPPVIVLQKESANWQRHRLRDKLTDRQTQS